MMNVLMIGAGYVGLVAAGCLATSGHRVTCLDMDKAKVSSLIDGDLPIYEPQLLELLQRALSAGTIEFTSDYRCVASAEVLFISVDTPARPSGECDLANVFAVAEQIGQHMARQSLIVLKSTAPVGTCESIRQLIARQLAARGMSDILFDVASNPEFLKEGSAVSDFTDPDRVVLGVASEWAENRLRDLYSVFPWERERVFSTDIASSEMIKYASNAMLATRITFMNEMAEICESLGADIEEVRSGLGLDGRIGPHFLRAGIGFGGSCFPKDLRALRAMAQSAGAFSTLIEAVTRVNDRQSARFAQNVIKYFAELGGLQGRALAVWGLAFKAQTDDLRESPALKVCRHLVALGAHLKLYDPVISVDERHFANCQLSTTQVTRCLSAQAAATGSAGLLVLTDWPEFCEVDFKTLGQRMQQRVIFDGRNQLADFNLGARGFDYFGVGRCALMAPPGEIRSA